MSFYLRRKHLHDRIISLRGEACEHKTSFTSSISIEVTSNPGNRAVMQMYIQVASVSTVFFYQMLVIFGQSWFFSSLYHTCTMDNLQISDKILNLNTFFFKYSQDLFSFNVDKSVLFDHKQSSKKITYLLHNMYTIIATCECLLCHSRYSY